MSNMRTVASNAVSILTSDVINRATTFILYALIARYLGAFHFGQLSLALTLFHTFRVFAVAGLKMLITREVARDKALTDPYLVNGSAAVVLSSLLAVCALYLFARVMNYAPETTSIILLLSLGLLPYSLSAICEAVFQAWEKMHYITYANSLANTAKAVVAFVMLSRGSGVYHITLLILASLVTIAVVEWWLMLRNITRPRLRLSRHFARKMTVATGTFLGIDGIIAIRASLSVVLLSKLAGETAVGLYSAASQLIIPATLILESIVTSIFPIMCRQYDMSVQGLKHIAEYLIALLLAIALPAAVGLYFLSDSALLLLYGNQDFAPASGVLRIITWVLVAKALTHVLGQVLLAGLQEKISLRIVAINTIIQLALGLVLIYPFGLIGAATATVLASVVNLVQHYLPVSRLLPEIHLGKLVWKPILSTACMALFLALAGRHSLIVTGASAGILYAGILCGLVIWSEGGPHALRAKYEYLWSQ